MSSFFSDTHYCQPVMFTWRQRRVRCRCWTFRCRLVVVVWQICCPCCLVVVVVLTDEWTLSILDEWMNERIDGINEWHVFIHSLLSYSVHLRRCRRCLQLSSSQLPVWCDHIVVVVGAFSSPQRHIHSTGRSIGQVTANAAYIRAVQWTAVSHIRA